MRTAARAARASITPQAAARAGDAIATALVGRATGLQTAVTMAGGRDLVLLYAGHGSELDPGPAAPALTDAGFRVAFPRVGADGLLEVVPSAVDDLAPGHRGLREPTGSALPPGEVGRRLLLVAVPGLAFTRGGRRLGQGGGHYDRLLARLGSRTRLVGIAHAVQVVDGLPIEPHDRTVDELLVAYDDGRVRQVVASGHH